MAMPGTLDGLGLAQWLRESHPEMLAVLITGYASQRHDASARGFTVLSKPCPPDALIAAVRNAQKKARSVDRA
jgi:DNA-binding NtrC family response regulator